ncbi:MAG TPA: CpsB/CapC family capsule biosynthesis tyrosine phosphatase [Atribacterota bacterium]|nr:CpsB/CapC family capsule biosynthesis tyrosine phosphatase [Atribacterota bacterium]
MIDIHCHILPNMDDGPSSWDTSLNMCRQQAVANGIKTIIATPHALNGIYKNHPQDIEEKVKILNQKIKENNLPLQVLPGSEVHLSADIIEAIKNKEVLTLNKSNYILLEFPHTQIPFHIEEILFQMQIMGITPILSHVERNLKFQQKPALLSRLIQKGVLAQITAASLCGFFGPIPKKIAQKFLSEGLVYSIASDAHTDSKKGRGSFFSQALTEASKIIGHQAALNLVHSNPQKIISNQ